MSTNLFSPIDINGQTVKNRVARGATRDYLFHDDGTVTDELIAVYDELAKNDVGLLITGVLACDDRIPAKDPQGSADGDRYVPGLKRIADTVHTYGSLVYGQLIHFGFGSEWTLTDKIECYTNGARTLQKAGFDGVELVEGILEGEEDAERIASASKIIEGIKNACGSAFTVIMKTNANHHETSRLIGYLRALQFSGLDAIEMCGIGWKGRAHDECAYFLDAAKEVKLQLDMPVILLGGLYSHASMQAALDSGIDMVSMCRPLLCEPDFVQRLKEGSAVSKCYRCNQCAGDIQKTLYKRCSQGAVSPFLKARFSENQ